MPIRFNSSGDYARLTSNLPAVDNFTICGWIKLKSNQTGTWRYYAGLEDAASSATAWVLTGINTDDDLELSTSGGADNDAVLPSLDTWIWFSVQTDPSDPDTFNAAYAEPPDETFGLTQQVVNSGVSFTPAVLHLGSDSWGEWVDCEMAHVKVWDRRLSSAELLDEYLYQLTPYDATNLRAYWPLADSTDTGDDSGNGYDLTFNGVATGGADPVPPLSSGVDNEVIEAIPRGIARGIMRGGVC
jgi:hypothetical protein